MMGYLHDIFLYTYIFLTDMKNSNLIRYFGATAIAFSTGFWAVFKYKRERKDKNRSNLEMPVDANTHANARAPNGSIFIGGSVHESIVSVNNNVVSSKEG